MVTVAWIAGKPLALLFDPFESLVRPYCPIALCTSLTGLLGFIYLR